MRAMFVGWLRRLLLSELQEKLLEEVNDLHKQHNKTLLHLVSFQTQILEIRSDLKLRAIENGAKETEINTMHLNGS